EAPVGRTFRIGGLVQDGSLKRENDGLTIRFTVTDTANTIPVVYKGILPDLFKEGRGCVAQGRVGPEGVFYADQIMSKLDENYMPPEAAKALEQGKDINKIKNSANEAARTLSKCFFHWSATVPVCHVGMMQARTLALQSQSKEFMIPEIGQF